MQHSSLVLHRKLGRYLPSPSPSPNLALALALALAL